MSSDEVVNIDWVKIFSRYPFCVFTGIIQASRLASKLALNGIRLVCWANDERDRKEVWRQWLEVTAISRCEKQVPPWIVIVDEGMSMEEVAELQVFAIVVVLDHNQNVGEILDGGRIHESNQRALNFLVNYLVKQEQQFTNLLYSRLTI